MRRKILFRADGSAAIGLGHVVRSCALANMLRDEFECWFIIRDPLPALKEEILKFCTRVIELPANMSVEDEQQAWIGQLRGTEIVVLDGYNFLPAYQQAILQQHAGLVCIDDLHNIQFFSDAVINHAPGINVRDYDIASYTGVFTGPDYVLLRPPFLEAVKRRQRKSTIRNLFICFGGTDYNNLTQKSLGAVMAAGSFEEIHVVTGAAYIHQEHLEAFANQYYMANANTRIILHHKLSAEEMAETIALCDVGICPCSSMLLELCSVGIGIISGYFIDNQLLMYEQLSASGVFTGVGDYNNLDLGQFSEIIRNMSIGHVNEQISRQQQLVDGLSPVRLRKLFSKLDKAMHVDVRRVEMNDAKQLFDWANDPVTRANAINKQPIPWAGHMQWLERKLASADSYMFIFRDRRTNLDLGLVRFDNDGEKFLISYLVDSEVRGGGWGEVIMKVGLRELERLTERRIYRALVMEDNIASSRVFLNLAFHSLEPVVIDNCKYNVYEK